MYCPNCDLQVETEFSIVRDGDEAERVQHYLDIHDVDVRGDYDIDDVGNVADVDIKVDSRQPTVQMRTDACANCGAYLDARTYVRP